MRLAKRNKDKASPIKESADEQSEISEQS